MSNQNKKITISALLFIFIFNGLFFLKPDKALGLSQSSSRGILDAIGSLGVCGITETTTDFLTDSVTTLVNGPLMDFLPFSLGGNEVPVKENDLQNITNKLLSSSEQIKKVENKIRTKEFCLDPFISALGKYLLRQMTNDLVAWIRGGFNGKPRFIQDFGGFLKDAADTSTGILLERILGKGNAAKLCEPWKINLTLKVLGPPELDDIGFDDPQCKLSDIIGAAENGPTIHTDFEKKRRVKNFMNDFEEGGWPAFFMTVFDDKSNPFGYTLSLMDKKGQLASKAQNAAQFEGTASNGILNGICMDTEDFTLAAHGLSSGKKVCARSKILTPGAAIVGALPDTISGRLKELEAADEISEIIWALFDVLAQKKFWEGIVDSNEPDAEGKFRYGFNGTVSTDGTITIPPPEPIIQEVRLLKPNNNETITAPIEFDWTDIAAAKLVKNYQIIITLPNQTQIKLNTPEAIDPDGTITPADTTDDFAPTRYQMTNTEFNLLDQGGIYTWQVAIISKKGEFLNGIEFRHFIIPESIITAPKEGEILADLITFRWLKIDIPDAIIYKIELKNLTKPSETLFSKFIEDTHYTQTQSEFNAMLGGEYSFKITPINKNTGTQVAKENSIKFKVLANPKLLTPVNNENISASTLSLGQIFDWENVPFANLYKIRIKKNSTTGFDEINEVTDSQFLINNLGVNELGEYLWKVRPFFRYTTIDEFGNEVEKEIANDNAGIEVRSFNLTP